MKKRWLGVPAVATAFLIVSAAAGYAASGALDPTFGTGGKATYHPVISCPVGAPSCEVRGVAQSGGKIVEAFYQTIIRLNTDGSLDTTYGTGGVMQLPTVNGELFGATTVADAGSGRVYVLGEVVTPSGGTDWAVVRLSSSGALDTTDFGGGTGFVITDFQQFDFSSQLTVDGSGRLVAVGESSANFESKPFFWALARYNSNGTPDTTFGTGGKVLSGTKGWLLGVVMQSDSKVVAAGRTTGGSLHGTVARFNADGTIDTTFGPTGGINTVAGTFSLYTVIIATNSGDIIAAGDGTVGTTAGWKLADFHIDGTYNTSFGSGGTTVFTWSPTST